jgi:hypothetical protein
MANRLIARATEATVEELDRGEVYADTQLLHRWGV